MQKQALRALVCAGAMVGALQTQAATVMVTDDVTTNSVWNSGDTYRLTKPIFVRDGATLRIEAGTLIRGEQAVGTDPGTLIVSRGAKLRAMGTAAAPIVFTDLNDDHYVGPTPVAGTAPYSTKNNGLTKKWGGVILLGETFIATNDGEPGTPSPNAALERQIEGLEPFGTFSKYGGGNDDSDSGEMHYVSIRYGGYVLGVNNEINGLTMGAVGRETDIDHIEVFQNKDDGFEWFGGTVNTKYLINYCNGDDSFDWDEGFRGKGQFWLTVQGPLSSESDLSDKAAEMDGGDGDAAQPSAVPTVFNATMVGLGKTTNRKKNTAMHFRDGSGGRFYNGLVMDFGGAPALIEGALANGIYDSADMCTSAYTPDAYYTHMSVPSAANKELEINRCLFWRMATNAAIGLPVGSGIADNWGASSEDENLAHYAYPIFTSGSLKNQYRTSSTCPVAQMSRAAVGVAISGTTYYPMDVLDPTLVEVPLLTKGLTPPADSFFTRVTFLGAFGQLNWAMPWSYIHRKGIVASAFDQSQPRAIAKANGSETDISVAHGTPVTLNGQMLADVFAGSGQVDWWIMIHHVTAGTWSYYRHSTGNWVWNGGALVSHQSQLDDVYGFNALSSFTGLSVGTHQFYFGCDRTKNGVLDGVQHIDTVQVTVTP